MKPSSIRNTLFVTLMAFSQFAGLGCAAEEGDDVDQVDPDGSGKGDGISSTSPERLFDTPFYFGVPKSVVEVALDRPRYPYPTLWNKSLESDEVGLRVIAVRQGVGVAARKTARREMATKLAAAGVLKDGDIVLTFRPELADTMAYPHIQMGSTHAGLVYTKNGAAFNIDSPLDTQYVGQFDTSHYAGNGTDDAGTDALHVLRPRISDERRVALRDWTGKLLSGLGRINGERQQIKFQSDYMTPAFLSSGKTTRQTVTTLGKIILEQDKTTKQPMYCSEFAWHMLALSNCTAEEIRAAGPEGASCVDEVFAPMPLTATAEGQIGLADGPLVSLLNLPAEDRETAVASVFATGEPAKLSSGHRMVSEQVAPLMPYLQQVYGARAQGAPIAAVAEGAGQLNAQVAPNYSPTAYLVQSMGDTATRKFDYVTTVTFVNGATYDKAKVLAQQPVP